MSSVTSTLASHNADNNAYKFQFEDITTQASEGIPSARCNHGCIAIGKYFYVVGGRGEGDDQRFNDVHILDTETMEWKRVEATGDIPPVSSSFTLSHVGDFVYLFGGKSNNTYSNSVFAFQHKITYNFLNAEETHTIVWRDVHALGEKPTPRYLHTACVVGKKIFVFGGVSADDVCLNDLHIFNTSTLKWLHFKTKGVPPTARARHSCCLSGNRMFVIGGMDSIGSNIYDMHALNIDCLTWSRVETNLEMIPPIAGATTLQFGSKLVMFGGLSDKHRPEGESTNELYVFDAILSVWYRAHVPDEAALPEARNGHRGAVIPGTSKVVFFGGWHCRFLGDLLVLETNITDTFQVNYQTTSFNKSSAFFAYDSERRRRFSIFDVEIIHPNEENGKGNGNTSVNSGTASSKILAQSTV